VGAVTFTRTMQLPLAATLPLEKEIEVTPATGAKVGVPQPEVVAPVGLATAMAPGDVGNVSVKFRPARATPLGLLMVKVSVEVPPAVVGSGAKDLAMVTSVGSRMVAMRALVAKSLL